jgi:hypothetical protein
MRLPDGPLRDAIERRRRLALREGAKLGFQYALLCIAVGAFSIYTGIGGKRRRIPDNSQVYTLEFTLLFVSFALAYVLFGTLAGAVIQYVRIRYESEFARASTFAMIGAVAAVVVLAASGSRDPAEFTIVSALAAGAFIGIGYAARLIQVR